MSEIEIEQTIVSRIQAELSPVQVQLRDMTGTRDHWEAIIITTHFDGMRAIARQQRVYKALGALMAGPIHAFTMTTLTPEEVNEDRLKFAQELTDEAEEDFAKLGLDLDVLKIQNVSDDVNEEQSSADSRPWHREDQN